MQSDKEMEARAGIEPACKDLQSSASPLRHRATVGKERALCRIAAKVKTQACGGAHCAIGPEWRICCIAMLIQPCHNHGNGNVDCILQPEGYQSGACCSVRACIAVRIF